MGRAGTPSRQCRRDQGLEDLPLFVGQIRRVGLAHGDEDLRSGACIASVSDKRLQSERLTG